MKTLASLAHLPRHRYTHRFSDGTTATLTLPDFDCEWSRDVGPALKPLVLEYLAWRDRCVAEYAETTGLRIATITLL
jgi:hypothetical protein